MTDTMRTWKSSTEQISTKNSEIVSQINTHRGKEGKNVFSYSYYIDAGIDHVSGV